MFKAKLRSFSRQFGRSTIGTRFITYQPPIEREEEVDFAEEDERCAIAVYLHVTKTATGKLLKLLGFRCHGCFWYAHGTATCNSRAIALPEASTNLPLAGASWV